MCLFCIYVDVIKMSRRRFKSDEQRKAAFAHMHAYSPGQETAVKTRMATRSHRAQSMDKTKTAKKTYMPYQADGVKKWLKHPDRYDIQGVDSKPSPKKAHKPSTRVPKRKPTPTPEPKPETKTVSEPSKPNKYQRYGELQISKGDSEKVKEQKLKAIFEKDEMLNIDTTYDKLTTLTPQKYVDKKIEDGTITGGYNKMYYSG
jgi:hypothetical protein